MDYMKLHKDNLKALRGQLTYTEGKIEHQQALRDWEVKEYEQVATEIKEEIDHCQDTINRLEILEA